MANSLGRNLTIRLSLSMANIVRLCDSMANPTGSASRLFKLMANLCKRYSPIISNGENPRIRPRLSPTNQKRDQPKFGVYKGHTSLCILTPLLA